MKPSPPKRTLKFLRWFCREDYLEEFEGDLIELFEQGYPVSPGRARRKFFWGVMRCFRPAFIKSFYRINRSNQTAMFRHNLLITFRNFNRYKSSFLINLTGLSVGIMSALLIYFWVNRELAVDAFHEQDERLYQVLRNSTYGTETQTHDDNSVLLPPALREELAEVEEVVTLANIWSEVYLSSADKKVKAQGKLAGKDFFKVFSYPLIKGNPERVLEDRNAIVISKQMAESLSPDKPIEPGQFISISGDTEYGARYAGDYVLTGIVDLRGLTVSEGFDFLLTHELFLSKLHPGMVAWNGNPAQVYVTLNKGTDEIEFGEKLNRFFQDKRYPGSSKIAQELRETMFLQPFSERYLYGKYENGVQAGGRIDYVILFSAIGFMVLLVACINFMNLSTAQAFRRLKEVGVKKVVGASRATLAWQYVTESVVLALMASLVAVLGAVALYPKLSVISGSELIIEWTPQLVLGVVIIAMVTGLIAGSYPAFFISRLRPIQVLKGKLKTSVGELLVRKGLVIFQFCVSLILIITVVVVNKQIDYVQTKNLGYDRDNVLSFPSEGSLLENHEVFLNEVRNLKGVRHAGSLLGDPTDFANSGGTYPRPGKPNVQFTFTSVGYDYVETMGIEILEGRSFSREFANEENKIILNETALKAMELEDPIGKIVNVWGKKEVIGIMKDFHFQSLHEEIKPSLLTFRPEQVNTLVVKVQAGLEAEVITELEQLYRSFNPNLPFDFRFLDEQYETHYQAEQRTAGLYQYFAAVAIFISCLGLLGLSAFTVQLRLKEIGIRKAMGSGVWKIVTLLTKDLTRTVMISLLISIPLGYYLSKDWLEGFAYRIDLQSGIFIFSGLGLVLLAWAIVALRAFRVARVNPVECLKEE